MKINGKWRKFKEKKKQFLEQFLENFRKSFAQIRFLTNEKNDFRLSQ